MKTLLIVYHTLTGGTLQMAQAAAAGGTREPDVSVRLESAASARPDGLLEADGYLFACPENLAAISGLMKDFFDRCYTRCWNGSRVARMRHSSARVVMEAMRPGRSSASLPAGGSRP
jgi:NAD(P)H-dependent FMN reductase